MKAFRVAASLACLVVGQAFAATMQSGVNLAGLDFNPGAMPGVLWQDYVAPSNSEYTYYRGKGLTWARLPFLWERLQPGLLTANCGAGAPALNPAYLHLIIAQAGYAAANGMQLVLDAHDFGAYSGQKFGTDSGPSVKQFRQFWTLVVTALKAAPPATGFIKGVGAIDIMNEPNGLPDATVWPDYAQAAVRAIRKAGWTGQIWIEGDGWSSAPNWVADNTAFPLSDPAKNLVYSAHAYPDADNSGTHFVWANEGVSVQTLAQHIAPFATWCQSKKVACSIGETGAPNDPTDQADQNTEFTNGLAAAAAGGLSAFTVWAGGPWWGSYPMSIEPSNGVDAPQMPVLSTYAH